MLSFLEPSRLTCLLLLPALASLATAQDLLPFERAVITPTGGQPGEKFGASLALDGDTLLVGSPFEGAGNRGAAYVFTGAGASWSQQQKLLASTPGALDKFGSAVAVSGEWAMVGALLDDDDGLDSGSVFVFQNQGGSWVETQRLSGSDTATGSHFGRAVDIEGGTAVVGAEGQAGEGAVYVFRLQGSTWVEEQKLLDEPAVSAPVRYGNDVDLDGDTLLVAAPTSGSGLEARAYVYRDTGTFVQEAVLGPLQGLAAFQIALSGETAVVGGDEFFGSVALTVYSRTGSTWTSQSVYATDDTNVALHGDRLASSFVFPGAADSVRIADRSGDSFDLRLTLTTEEKNFDDEFGAALLLTEDSLFVSAPVTDGLIEPGRVLVYGLSEGPGVPFCFGAGCPCGNDDPLAGCLNSTGEGAIVTGSGTGSVAADDLVFTAAGFPAGESGLWFMGGDVLPPVFVGDGLACTGGLFRFLPSTTSGAGELTLSAPIAAAPAGVITPGDTRHFQAWCRDVLCGPPPAPCPSPCGNQSNVSSGYSVLFTP